MRKADVVGNCEGFNGRARGAYCGQCQSKEDCQYASPEARNASCATATTRKLNVLEPRWKGMTHDAQFLRIVYRHSDAGSARECRIHLRHTREGYTRMAALC